MRHRPPVGSMLRPRSPPSLSSRCWQGHVPSGACRGGSFLPPWACGYIILSLCLHTASPLHVCGTFSVSYQDTSHWIQDLLIQDDRIYRAQFHSVSSAKTLFPSTFTGFRGMSLLRTTTQPGGRVAGGGGCQACCCPAGVARGGGKAGACPDAEHSSILPASKAVSHPARLTEGQAFSGQNRQS